MVDKIDAIISGSLKPKPKYYFSSLFLKIVVIIVLLVVALEMFELV